MQGGPGASAGRSQSLVYKLLHLEPRKCSGSVPTPACRLPGEPKEKNFPLWRLLVIVTFFSYYMELWGKSSLSFRMWTAGRSSACKLQQGLNSQGLAKRQGGHGWLGLRARAPTAQEPSWGSLPGPSQLSPCLDDRQALCCFSQIMETNPWARME